MVAIAPRRARWTSPYAWRTELVTRTLRAGANAVVAGTPAPNVRRRLERLAAWSPPPRDLRRRNLTLAGLPATRFEPKDPRGLVLLHLHGGGYAVGSVKTHQLMVADLVRATGCSAVALEYRLAPEHPFPVPVDDCVAGYRALVASGVDPKRIVLTGDSAGGALALAATQRLRDEGDPLPRALVLLSPWVDLRCQGASIEENAKSDYLSRPVLERFAQLYLQGADPAHPEASPSEACFEGFPPMLVQAGGGELLLSEIQRTVRRAREAGVAADLQVWNGMFHAWHGFSFLVPEAAEAFAAVGRWTRRLT